MNLRDLGEFGLIHHLSSRLATRPGVRLGIGDDAAVLDSLTAPIVTCDALVENVHFRRDWTTPRALGRKALCVNVSDLAASGAAPVAAFIALALSPQDDLAFVEELYAGMEEIAALYGFSIAGGDTVRSSAGTAISVTLIGEALSGGPVLRSGATPGDVLLVTGSLGDAAAGLALLQNPGSMLNEKAAAHVSARHHEPTARLAEMQAALPLTAAAGGRAVRAALDLSDGLAGDARHIAARSGVTVEIEEALLPISAACRSTAAALGASALQWALAGGEDYELLLCVAPEAEETVKAAIQSATGTAVTRIGHCVQAETDAVVLITQNNATKNKERAAISGAFTHF